MNRALIIGLDHEESESLRARVDLPLITTPLLPRLKLEGGRLFVERPGTLGAFLEVHKVVYHGIFENDFDTLAAMSIWNGPCLPDATGMMDCRLRIPCLARSLKVTRFGSMPRGWGADGTRVSAPGTTGVSKWGNWHCGENKELFSADWTCAEPTIIEQFIPGQAIRIMIVGNDAWQIALTGTDWRKSIHPQDAHFQPIDPALLADARALGQHFRLDMLGVDYMLATDGTPHLLEVNHIPNVTRFPEIRDAFLNDAAAWLGV